MILRGVRVFRLEYESQPNGVFKAGIAAPTSDAAMFYLLSSVPNAKVTTVDDLGPLNALTDDIVNAVINVRFKETEKAEKEPVAPAEGESKRGPGRPAAKK